MSKSSECREQWINDIAYGLREVFGIEPKEAQERAADLMDSMCDMRPADKYYWPARDKSRRDEQIAREFNGRNLTEVTRRHRVSQRTVYNIRSKALQKRA